MIKNDRHINKIAYGDIVLILSENNNISLDEARSIISKMSFKEYCSLIEADTVVPPSGLTIGNTPAAKPTVSSTNAPNPGMSKPGEEDEKMWTGGNLETGMSLDLATDTNTPQRTKVKNINQSAKTVEIIDPKTNQSQTYSISDPRLTPIKDAQTGLSDDLQRMKHLAGIHEDSSGGASSAGGMGMASGSTTSAGNIASSTASFPGIKKRQQTKEEGHKQEYKPEGVPKTISGDSKPHQASRKLSADLAASGKISAFRGRKKR